MTMTLTPATNRQLPDNSILDINGKQVYLGNQYTYALGGTEITSTSEAPLLLLSNPAVTASGFPSNYVSLFCNIRKMITLTDTENCILRFYLSPTVTGAGTPAAAVNRRGGSLNTTVGVIATGATVSSNGSLVDMISSLSLATDESNSLIVLDPGNDLLVTVQPSSTSTFISAVIGWYQL